MIHVQGKIRDYDPAADTASIEMDGIGIIDAWLDNIKIDASLNRAFLVHGAPCTLQAPDEHRIGESILVAIGQKPSAATGLAGAASTQVQYGRTYVPTDSAGTGSGIVTYPYAYASAPTVHVAMDDDIPFTVTTPTATGFAVQVTGATPDTFLYFSWQADGH